MTYRSNFEALCPKETKKHIKSDSGWGCMLRVGQMMLANTIIRH